MSTEGSIPRLPAPWLARLAVVASLIGLALIFRATATPFAVVVDGQRYSLSSHTRSVGQALADAGWAMGPGDWISPALGTGLTSGMKIEIRRASPVEITTPDGRQTVLTASRIPVNILSQAGVRVFPGDEIHVDGLPAANPGAAGTAVPHRLSLVPASRVTISLPDRTVELRTRAATVAQALEQAGFSGFESDQIQPEPGAPIRDLMTIHWVPSRPIEVAVDGSELSLRASADTVGPALAQAGVSLVGLDYARPASDQPVPDDGKIQVVRVTEQVRVELSPVAFDTQYQPLSQVEIDQQQLITPGAYGVRASQVRVRYEDGVESGKLEEGTWEPRSPEDRVVGYGTQIVVRSVATSDGTIEYWRAVQMWATSYSASRAGVSPEAKNYGITASGKPLTKGLVAIDRRYIPFGTTMYVPGYGFALAADTGSGVKGRWIDLGYDDDNWVSWHQYVTVYFLTPVPPESSIVWIFP